MQRKSLGFTLIEILVAISIMAVALLGLAMLQIDSIKRHQDANQKIAASILANDMIEKIRGNLLAANANFYQNLSLNKNFNFSQRCLGVSLYNDGDCSIEEIAALDYIEWQKNITSQLPNAIGQICRTSNPKNNPLTLNCDNRGSIYVVSISWIDKKNSRKTYRVAFNI